MNVYLISGTHGFIGSHLTKHFRDKGDPVSPIPQEDLYAPQKLYDLVDTVRPTHIIHCASYGNMAYQNNETMTLQANIITTHNLLSVVKDFPHKVFVYLSSSSAYGVKKKPMNELDSLDGDTYYAAAKIAAEALIRASMKQHYTQCVIVRPFSVYGPGEADFRFIPTAIRSIKNEQPMKVSSGMHDWIYISDFVNGIVKVLDNASYLLGKAVNIGTGKQYDNIEVVQELCWLANKKVDKMPIEFVNSLRSFDSDCWVADNKLLKALGWKQKYALSEGLKRCFEYYK